MANTRACEVEVNLPAREI